MLNYVINICFLLPLLTGYWAKNIVLEIQEQIVVKTTKEQAAMEIYAGVICCITRTGQHTERGWSAPSTDVRIKWGAERGGSTHLVREHIEQD